VDYASFGACPQGGEGTVGKLLTDEALYATVNQLSSESVKLLYDFRQNPKKYLTIKFQLF
jgi:phospholipid/cholesterol/gamma-HCH transport system substrate-binding protein